MITISKKLIALSALLTSVFFCGCTESQTIDFKYKSAPETVREYSFKSSDKMVSVDSAPTGADKNAEGKETAANEEQEVTTSFILSEKTIDVNQNNDIKFEILTKNMKLSKKQDGKTQEIPIPDTGRPITFKINERGVGLEINGTEISKDDPPQDLLTKIPFDVKPTTIGQTWEQIVEIDKEIQPNTYRKLNKKTVYTFKGYEKYNKKNMARIEEQVTLTESLKITPPKPEKTEESKSEEENLIPDSITTSTEGTGTGYYLYDVTQGCIVKGDRNSQLKVVRNINMKAKDNKIETRQNTTNLESSVQFELQNPESKENSGESNEAANADKENK